MHGKRGEARAVPSAARGRREEPGITTDPARRVERSFCRLCGALCGVEVIVEDGVVVEVRGDPGHPLSRGYLCGKGRALGHLHHAADRVDRPAQRSADGALVDTTWPYVLDDLAARLRRVLDEHGPDAVGIYTGTYTGFDSLGGLAGAAFVRGIGTTNMYTPSTIDAVARRYVLGLVSGYPSGVLFPIPDLDRCSFMLLVGTNPVVSHGAIGGFTDPVRRLRAIQAHGEVWVIDPRVTETAKLATQHLHARAGSDPHILAYVVRELLRDGADTEYVRDHVSGVEALRALVEPFDRATVADRAGVDETSLDSLVEGIRRAGRIVVLTGTGTTMHPARNVTEYLAWALLAVTGSLDRPGGVWFNPSFLRRVDRPASAGLGDQERFQLRRTGYISREGPPSRPDLPRPLGEVPCAALADQIAAGEVRAFFAIGGDPLTAFPQPQRLAERFRMLDAMVALDVRWSATAREATHVLPCLGQLERPDVSLMDGMYAAVAGQYTPAIVEPVAERRPMWWILAQLARRLDFDVVPGDVDLDVASDEQMLDLMVDSSRLDLLRAASGPHIEEHAVIGWFVDGGFLDDDRWDFDQPEIVAQAAMLHDPPGLVLIPRRQRRRFNSVAASTGSHDDAEVLLNPVDAAPRRITDGDRVRVSSASGSIEGRVRLTPDIAAGAVSVPHGHEGPRVGELTSDRDLVDRYTGMVTQAGVPVDVAPVGDRSDARVRRNRVSG